MGRAERVRLAYRRMTEAVSLALAVRNEDPADPVIWPERYDVVLCSTPGHGYHRVDYNCESGGPLDAGNEP